MFAEASGWFFRLRSEDAGPDDFKAFECWLAADPAHAEAFEVVRRMFEELEPAAKALAGKPARKTLLRPMLATAAVVVIATVLVSYWQPDWLQGMYSDYHTGTGEQQHITLADGSKLLLNTGSAINVDFAGNSRRIDLLHGEVYFQVAHDRSKPFRVLAGQASALVTGTEFSVSRIKNQVDITVAKGRVETGSQANPEQAVSLAAGESARYDGTRLAALEKVDTDKILAWRQNRLVFVQAPLQEVIREINRYRPGQIWLTNPALEKRPITAVFSIDRLDEAVDALEQTFGIHVRRVGGYLIFLS